MNVPFDIRFRVKNEMSNVIAASTQNLNFLDTKTKYQALCSPQFSRKNYHFPYLLVIRILQVSGSSQTKWAKAKSVINGMLYRLAGSKCQLVLSFPCK